MIAARSSKRLEQIRQTVAGKVRALRAGRRLTQAELAAQLGLSQGRLSELERGNGSFTAEQLLFMLKLFNVTASHFAPPTVDHDAQIQNALARLGAVHLRESSDLVPYEQLDDLGEVVREALLAGAPRLLTALAPVLVRNINRVHLGKLRIDLAQAGLERRLAWLVENTLVAVRAELTRSLPRPLAQRYRRADTVLEMFLELATSQAAQQAFTAGSAPPDLLDATISSAKTRHAVAASSSAISQRWRIITSLQPDDFIEALRAANVH
ncbi:MAG: helix-turn-helix transcriptional regulator [Byssovorax sp.]